MLRPLTASLAVFAVLSVGVSDADVAQPRKPSAVKAWFGEWKTDGSGTLEIYDARYIPALSGGETCPCTWSLVAGWRHPNGREVLVRGVLGKDNRVWSAGFPLGDGRYGSIRASRSGDRFSGFWKPCRTYCKTTKWTAQRHTSERFRVGWRLTQSGLPKGATTIRTRTGGAGSLIFRRRQQIDGYPSAGSKVFHIDLIPGYDDLRLDLVPSDTVDYYRPGRERRDVLIFKLQVARSNDPGCAIGAEASMRLVDSNGQGPDEAELRFDGDPGCRHTERWLSTDANRLSVVVSGLDRE